MAILHNGNEYSSTKIINYSAAPDYNRGVIVDNIQSGNYQATDNGFLFIQLQSQQSNPTKVSVIRSKTPITDTGTEIASIVLSQYQYSETLTAQVMAREYYKLTIDGAGNPQVLSCIFYPYTSNVPIKLTEDITMEQVVGLESELDGKQNKGNYFNKDTDKINLANQVTGALGTNNIANNAITNAKISNSAVTDAKFSGVLSIAKGGTGTTDGFNWKNIINKGDFFKKIGFTAGGTTQQFIQNIPSGTNVYIHGYFTKIELSDLPRVKGSIAIISTDANTKILKLYTPYNYEEWLYTTSNNVGNGWIKIRNADGTLPVSIGGTGNATGLNYTNYCGLYPSVCSMLGIENTPRTIQEFWNKMPSMLDITFLATNESITDLPTGAYYYINITKQDGNLSWITLKHWRSNTTYLAYVADDIVSTWVLVRKRDGTLPADLIPPTVLKYENSDGVWTETKLTTGKVMLEGYIKNNAGGNISLPKTVNVDNTYVRISYNGGAFSMSGDFPSYTVESNRIIINASNSPIDSLDISIVAFLA